MQPERHILQVIHHHRISRSPRVCSNLRSAGIADAFVTKLNPNGATLDFSTYLGGNGSDIGYGIAINAAGNAYVTGQTLSTNFLLVSSVKAPDQNMLDAFVTKLTPNGAKAVYSTLAGGASTEQANGIAVDTAGSAYITGVTLSNNIASSIPGGALSGTQDAFFMKFSDCAISFAPSSASPGVNGGSGAFTVNAPANCSWTAFTTNSFVQINSGSGTGPGTVNYTVASNSGAARTGSIAAEAATFTISQAGSGISSTAPYNISVTPSSGSGSSSTFTARYGTARPGGAPINRAYLLINNTLNGVGACYVEYTVSSNSFRLLNDSGNTWQAAIDSGNCRDFRQQPMHPVGGQRGGYRNDSDVGGFAVRPDDPAHVFFLLRRREECVPARGE